MPNITSYKYLKCFCITLYIQVKMINTKKTRMITVRMPKELDFQLSILSKKKFMSRSAIIKESLRKFLGGYK